MATNASTASVRALPVKLLVIEDDPLIAAAVAAELELEGFTVQVEGNGLSGLAAARQQAPDLIILDRMLPGLDGMEVCRRLRQSMDVPIIMLTAVDRPEDRVEGLNLGANDYLGKPFLLEELIARINAQLRARRPQARTVLGFGDLTLDLETHEVRQAERLISLTPKEFDLLHYLMQHARQVKTREQIVENVWGHDFEGESNVVDVYVRYLRNKLERPGQDRLVHTVRGIGYVLRDETAEKGY